MDIKETLLEKSFKLFLNEGYREISINRIVQECGISKGAFYHHFKSKEDLYMEVLERFFFSYFKNSDFVYNKNINFKDKIEQFIYSFVTPYEELLVMTEREDLIPYFRFLFQAAGHHSLIKYKVNKHFYKKGYYLSLLIAEQQEENIINRHIDAKLIAHQLLSLILGITILDGIYDAAKIKAHLISSIELYIQLIINKADTHE